MMNAVISAISDALMQEFGEGCRVCTEPVNQEAEKPYFYAVCESSSISPAGRDKYSRSNRFCIHYHPREGEANWECGEAAERLIWRLGQLTIAGGAYRGTAMKFEIAEGALHFYVNYDCYVCRGEKQETAMETMKTEQYMKGTVK